MPLPFISPSRLRRDFSLGGTILGDPGGSGGQDGNRSSRDKGAAPVAKANEELCGEPQEGIQEHASGCAVIAWANAAITILNRWATSRAGPWPHAGEPTAPQRKAQTMLLAKFGRALCDPASVVATGDMGTYISSKTITYSGEVGRLVSFLGQARPETKVEPLVVGPRHVGASEDPSMPEKAQALEERVCAALAVLPLEISLAGWGPLVHRRSSWLSWPIQVFPPFAVRHRSLGHLVEAKAAWPAWANRREAQGGGSVTMEEFTYSQDPRRRGTVAPG